MQGATKLEEKAQKDLAEAVNYLETFLGQSEYAACDHLTIADLALLASASTFQVNAPRFTRDGVKVLIVSHAFSLTGCRRSTAPSSITTRRSRPGWTSVKPRCRTTRKPIRREPMRSPNGLAVLLPSCRSKVFESWKSVLFLTKYVTSKILNKHSLYVITLGLLFTTRNGICCSTSKEMMSKGM